MKNKRSPSKSIEDYIDILEDDENTDDDGDIEYYSIGYEESEEDFNTPISAFDKVNPARERNESTLYDKSNRDNFDYYEIYPLNSTVEDKRNMKILFLAIGVIVYFSGITVLLPSYPVKEQAIGLYCLLAVLPLALYIPCVSMYQNSRYLLAIKSTKKLTKLQENFKTGIEYDSNIIERLEKNHYRLYSLGSSFVFRRIKQALIKQERILRIKKANIDTIIKGYLKEDLI